MYFFEKFLINSKYKPLWTYWIFYQRFYNQARKGMTKGPLFPAFTLCLGCQGKLQKL